jgi:hypothetical protein
MAQERNSINAFIHTCSEKINWIKTVIKKSNSDDKINDIKMYKYNNDREYNNTDMDEFRDFVVKQIEYFEQRQQEVKDEECGVCLEKDKQFKFFKCSHHVCSECYPRISPKICPMCRQHIVLDNNGMDIRLLLSKLKIEI